MGKFMLMPKLDMSMEEGVIVEWLVKIGDTVEKGDIVVEIETGKVNLEVDNTAASGTVLAFLAGPGDRIDVNEPILYIGEEGEKIPAVPSKTAPAGSEQDSAEMSGALSAGEPKSEEEYNLAVIGGGPGGYVAAIRAAQLGARVVLFEEDRVGGVCLNRGCIPTKALIKSARLWNEILHAGEHGLSVSEPSFDWGKILKRKEGVVARLTSGVAGLLKKNGVTLISARARLDKVEDGSVISVGRKTYTVDKVILAVGSVSSVVPLQGDDSIPVYTAESILSLDPLPESLVIIGGGVIGCEMASLYASFGVSVSLVEMLPQLVPGADSDVRTAVMENLEKQGVEVLPGTTVDQVSQGSVFLSSGETRKADALLMAVGRRAPEGFPANTVNEALNLAVSERNWVRVDEDLSTSLPGIFAIGDITGGIQLAHTASAQGMALAESLFSESKVKRAGSLGPVPSCLFTFPEAAWVGLTEEEALSKRVPLKVSRFPFSALGKAVSTGEAEGFVKIITDRRWGEILGIHIVGAEASVLIGEALVLLGLEATAEEVSRMIHPHPSLTEAFLEAAEGINLGAIHL